MFAFNVLSIYTSLIRRNDFVWKGKWNDNRMIISFYPYDTTKIELSFHCTIMSSMISFWLKGIDKFISLRMGELNFSPFLKNWT